MNEADQTARQLLQWVLSILTISAGSTILLVPLAIVLVYIDPFINVTIRQIITLVYLSGSTIPNFKFSVFVKYASYYAFLSPVIWRPRGTIVFLALQWFKNGVLPPIMAYLRAEQPDERAMGNFLTSFVPLVYFCFTALFFTHLSTILAVLWLCASHWICYTIVLPLFIAIPILWSYFSDTGLFITTFSRVIIPTSRMILRIGNWFLGLLKLLNRFDEFVIAKRESILKPKPNHRYEELLSGHIRLLKIKRRIPFTPMECELVHVNLSEAPEYEAISYCWGTDPPNKTISISRRTFKVLNAAYEVIKFKHSFLGEKLVWIDSICINQNDFAEKGGQIQLMRVIFSRAIRVVAWLGDLENASYARGMISILITRGTTFGEDTETLATRYVQNYDAGWIDLAMLLCKPWFTRMWILQEVALAKTVHLIWGNICMDWDNFQRVLPIITDPMLIGFLRTSNIASETMKPIMGAKNATIMAHHRKLTLSEEHIGLEELLEQAMSLNATDPHDKVYAVLGLVTDGSNEKLLPDYTQPVEKLYVNVMRYLLQTNDPLYVLHLAGNGTDRMTNLPSWVPDWSNKQQWSWQFTKNHIYAAGTRYHPNVIVPEDDNRYIQVAGNAIDEIAMVGSIAPWIELQQEALFDRTTFDSFRIWQRECIEMIETYLPEPYMNGNGVREPQSRKEALWRTMIADKGIQLDPADKSFEKYYDAWEWTLGLSPDSDPDNPPYLDWDKPASEQRFPSEKIVEISNMISPFCYCIGRGCLGRRLAVTKGGLLAIVPPKTQVGDFVCVLWGAQTPYLLRADETKVAEGPSWQLIGSTFVHGLMNGEGLSTDGFMFNLI